MLAACVYQRWAPPQHSACLSRRLRLRPTLNKRANLVWDEENLRTYIADPQAKVPGNRMPFAGLHDPKDVDDVIAYLETLK